MLECKAPQSPLTECKPTAVCSIGGRESKGLVEVLHVFSKHRVPSQMTSDCGTEFVSHFFRSLGKVLDVKLHFTSGYYPEGDRQTECTNLDFNYQQDDWSKLLHLAEFAYNNVPSATTGISPFIVNKGYHPNITAHPEQDLSSTKARDFVVDLAKLHQEL